MMKLVAHLRRHKTSSEGTLRQYVNKINKFCEWAGFSPDHLVNMCLTHDGLEDPKAVKDVKHLLDSYVGELQARNVTPSTINLYVNAMRTLLRVNDVSPPKILMPQRYAVYPDRSPKPEELMRMLEVADLRGKVIVSCLA
ncbi:MAG: hypothetical protein ACUVTD_05740 [Nitrososphaerales archaeon]